MSQDIGLERRGATGVITLQRAPALNALTEGMRQAIAGFVPELARDPQIYGVVIKSALPKVFCAGGDVRALARQMRESPAEGLASLAAEYRLVWLLECFSKPTVALLDGAVIGAGAGITINATHRVASEGYSFAMPETMIGFFPDDGLAFTFARLPDHIGPYLGLTGRAIGRADAYRLGIATHCIARARLEEIETLFADAEPIDPVLDSRHEDPGAGELERYREVIADCFGAPTVTEILARLDGSKREVEWCQGVALDLRARSPLALAVTLRHIREAADLDVRLTLTVDYRIASQLAAAGDFQEGVRALLVDKTRDPKWSPAQIEDVLAGHVDRCFQPQHGEELVLPTRQEMQAARV